VTGAVVAAAVAASVVKVVGRVVYVVASVVYVGAWEVAASEVYVVSPVTVRKVVPAAGVEVTAISDAVVAVAAAEVWPWVAEAPLSVYTFRLLMSQYVSWKADGLFWTKSWHVDAWAEQVESVDQTLPAQSPQKVTSKTNC
jgi:hypothetical protein